MWKNWEAPTLNHERTGKLQQKKQETHLGLWKPPVSAESCLPACRPAAIQILLQISKPAEANATGPKHLFETYPPENQDSPRK